MELTSRRHFLKTTLAAAGGMLLPLGVFTQEDDASLFICIHLAGGNDAWNTLTPWRSETYYKARPTLALPPGDLCRLTDEWALHPRLSIVRDMMEDGECALVADAGFALPKQSHYLALKQWRTFLPEATAPAAEKSFERQIQSVMRDTEKNRTRKVYHVTLTGFDTHVHQAASHNQLLKSYAAGLEQLASGLKRSGAWKRTTILTYSEFGRSWKENAFGGTHHGSVNHIWLCGGKLKESGLKIGTLNALIGVDHVAPANDMQVWNWKRWVA